MILITKPPGPEFYNTVLDIIMKDNKLKAFLKKFDGSPAEPGTVAEWRSGLSAGSLQLTGGRLGIADAWQVPGGLTIALDPGDYEVEAVCAVFGSDARVARIQVRKKGLIGDSAELLGEFDADSAAAGVFDADAMLEFADRSPESHQNWADRFIDHHCGGAETGTFACRGAKTSVVFLPTGFGDGRYPVHALRRADELIGVEAVFIRDDTPYPFEGAGDLNGPSCEPGGGQLEREPPWRALGEKVVERYGDILPDRDCRLTLELEFHLPDPGCLDSFHAALRDEGLTPCTDAYSKWLAKSEGEAWDDSPRADGVVQARACVPLDVEALNLLGQRLRAIAQSNGGDFQSWGAAWDMHDGEPQEMAQSRALELLKAGDVDGSLALLTELVTLGGPFAQDCWEALGVALQQRGDIREATTAFRRAVKLDPNRSSARNGLGVTLLQAGKIDEAAAQWREVLKSQPEHAQAHYNLACVAARRDESATALDHLRIALRHPKLRKLAKSDTDLESLRQNPEFKTMLKR